MFFSLHRLEHIDEVIRAARLSGYLDMRMVLIAAVIIFTLLDFRKNFTGLTYFVPQFLLCSFPNRDGQLYLENLFQLMTLMLMIGFLDFLSFRDRVSSGIRHASVTFSTVKVSTGMPFGILSNYVEICCSKLFGVLSDSIFFFLPSPSIRQL